MRVLVHSQHVLGVGHFFRIMALCEAMVGHDVVLASGGRPVGFDLPPHVSSVDLPALRMDRDFKNLLPDTGDGDVARIQEERKERLLEAVREHEPDILLVELFPFGRNRFASELVPALELARELGARSVCSQRDILVEKTDQAKYEARVVEALNKWFDMVLVHSDPEVIHLSETFSRLDDIRIPVIHTGYVSRPVDQEAVACVRPGLGVADEDALVLVSAGGGAVGFGLLRAACLAGRMLAGSICLDMRVFPGPFLEKERREELEAACGPDVRLEQFVPDFQDVLAAGDLSLSMAGYNTCMNLLAAGTKGLIYPFMQNREQPMRAARLKEQKLLGVLSPDDLDPRRLAERMMKLLSAPPPSPHTVNLEGARESVRILEGMVQP